MPSIPTARDIVALVRAHPAQRSYLGLHMRRGACMRTFVLDAGYIEPYLTNNAHDIARDMHTCSQHDYEYVGHGYYYSDDSADQTNN